MPEIKPEFKTEIKPKNKGKKASWQIMAESSKIKAFSHLKKYRPPLPQGD
jgi:hypothetical protein